MTYHLNLKNEPQNTKPILEKSLEKSKDKTLNITKECSNCKLEKSLDEFGKQLGTTDNKKYICKKCDSARAKLNYEKNKETRLRKITEWQEKNPDKVKEYKSKYKTKRALEKSVLEKSPTDLEK